MIIIVTVVAAFFFLSAVVAMLMVKLSVTPNWKKVRKLLSWTFGIIVLVVICVFIWNHIPSKQTSPLPTQTQTTNLGATKAPEEWVFTWSLPPGQADRGLNSNTLEAKIERNDSTSLWFSVLFTYKGKTEISHQYLTKSGDCYKGSWSQNNPIDGGSIYMNKVGEKIWVGQQTDRSGRLFACTLKRK